nr:hypothetical protein [Tanacetum cinerariifolium]
MRRSSTRIGLPGIPTRHCKSTNPRVTTLLDSPESAQAKLRGHPKCTRLARFELLTTCLKVKDLTIRPFGGGDSQLEMGKDVVGGISDEINREKVMNEESCVKSVKNADCDTSKSK